MVIRVKKKSSRNWVTPLLNKKLLNIVKLMQIKLTQSANVSMYLEATLSRNVEITPVGLAALK